MFNIGDKVRIKEGVVTPVEFENNIGYVHSVNSKEVVVVNEEYLCDHDFHKLNKYEELFEGGVYDEFSDDLLELVEEMSVTTLSGVKLTKGTIIDIGQTVNGYSKFAITKLEPLTVHYVNDGFELVREYEYSVKELLQLEDYHSYDDPIKIVGHTGGEDVELTDTTIMTDEFEEMSMEEIIKMNNSIPNSNVEFIDSINLEGKGDEESYSEVAKGLKLLWDWINDEKDGEDEEVENDLVKSPNHYIGELGLEVEEVLRNFIPRYEDAYVAHRIASAIEYLLRSPLKNGTQDLEKARYNIGQALEHIGNKDND